MELSDLRIFRAVVESGGITRAAEKLHRVPSNVTSRIQKLEQELEQALFIRENRRLRLSPAGEQLLDYAKRLLSLADEALDQLKCTQPKGLLRIGCIEMAAATRLVEPLRAFHQLYPEVTLKVESQPTGILLDRILAGELDIALVSDPEKDTRLDIKKVHTETLVMVSDAHHGPIKKPADLGAHPTLLAFSPHCMYRRRLSDWLRQDEVIATVIEVNSYHALLSCATAGMGVAIAPQAVVDIYPYPEGLKIHPLPAQWRRSATSLVWRKDSLKPSMGAFAEVFTG